MKIIRRGRSNYHCNYYFSLFILIFAVQSSLATETDGNLKTDLEENRTTTTTTTTTTGRRTTATTLLAKKVEVLTHKIYFSSTRASSLKAGETFCKNEGGRLATIKSPAENARAFAAMKPNNFYWIGLIRSNGNEPWRWADGTQPVYVNWNEGEPNNKDDEEFCVEAYSHNGKWNDVGCQQWVHKMTLCEKATKPPCLPPRKDDESLIGFWLVNLESYNEKNRPAPVKEKMEQLCGDLDPAIEGPFGQNNTAFVLTCQNGSFFPALNTWVEPRTPVTSFTISFYYRYTETEPGIYGLMAFQDDSPKPNFVIDYQVKENGSATLIISFGPGPAISRMSVQDIMQPKKWNFISVMFDGSTMQLTVLYYNNGSKLEAVVSNALLVGSRGFLAIGQGNYAMPVKKGAISCLLFYRLTLTALELEQIQQACRYRQTGKCEQVSGAKKPNDFITVADRRKPLPPQIPSLLGVWFLDDLYGLENKIPGKTRQPDTATCAVLEDLLPGPFGRQKTSMKRQCESGELVQFQWLFPSTETLNWLDSYTVSFYFFAQPGVGKSDEEKGILQLYPYIFLTYNETRSTVEARRLQQDGGPVVSVPLTSGEWHFVAVTFQLATKTLTLYQNSSAGNDTASALVEPYIRTQNEEDEFKLLIGSDGRSFVKSGDRFSCLFLYGAALVGEELERIQAVCQNRLSPEKAEDPRTAVTSRVSFNWSTLVPTRETVLPTSTIRSTIATVDGSTPSLQSDLSVVETRSLQKTAEQLTKKHFFTIHFRPFRDAERSCESAGGRIALIKSAEENAQASAIMQSDYPYWIGLRRSSATEQWHWNDGTPLNFTKWNTGEPNNANGDEWCVEYAANGRWNDVQCLGSRGVLCEEQIRISTNTDLEEPYEPYNEYFAIEVNMTWFGARDKCIEEGGDLAMIKSTEENARAYEVMTASDRSRTFWIGLRRENADAPWLWVDGTEVNYTNWNYGEPNNNHDNEFCATSRPGQRRRWNDLRCDYDEFYAVQLNWDDTPYALCERRNQNGETPQAQATRSRKKFFAIYGAYRADRATSLCQELGGRPASIKSAAENAQAVNIMDPKEQYWIGLSRGLGVHEPWIWPDGSDPEYENWNWEQPDSRGGNEWCVEYRWQRWNYLACENIANILCEKIYLYYDNLTSSNAFPEQQEKKYFAVYEPHLNWQDARAKCQRNGGRLATIKSPEENSRAILTMKSVPGIYWIGLSRANETSPWQWVDGVETVYSNWDDSAGEPNNLGGDELCAEARIHGDHPQMSYRWNDLSCENTRRNKIALCEKFVHPPTTRTPKLRNVTLAHQNSSTTIGNKIDVPGGKGHIGNIVLGVAVVMGSVQVAALVFYYARFVRRPRFCGGCRPRRNRANADDDAKVTGNGMSHNMTVLQNNTTDVFEVTWDQVTKSSQVLGEGDFGLVIRGKLAVPAASDTENPSEVDVAIKMLPENATEEQRTALLKEIQLLKHLSDVCGPHPNVVSLLACITAIDNKSNSGQMALLMEYCSLGPLRNYLRNLRGRGPQEIAMLRSATSSRCESPAIQRVTFHPSTRGFGRQASTSSDSPSVAIVRPDLPEDQNRQLFKLLLSYAEQVCSGMEHIARNMFVHRNLAARNILVYDYDNVKIAHFHMARDVYEDPKGFKVAPARVHVKWTAPEALDDRVYTTASDVWSFGVVLWELVTLGAMPYSLVLNQEMVSVLKKGHRLERPSRNCPEELYDIMLSCWVLKPDDRPTFTLLRQRLQNLQRKNTDEQQQSSSSSS